MLELPCLGAVTLWYIRPAMSIPRRATHVRFALALWLIAGLLSLPRSAFAEPPKAVIDAVCRPTFQVGKADKRAGTAFVMETGLKNIPVALFTAHHLFGPDGGMGRQMTWQEVPKSVKGASCESFDRKHRVKATAAVPVTDARTYSERGGPMRDIAVLPVPAAEVTPLKLAKDAPAIGANVWLIGQAFAGAPATLFLHKAKVVLSGDIALSYEFADPKLNLAGTSGAPIVNENGEVVAISLAGGLQRGRLIVGGNNVRVIRTVLDGMK
jgi:hypothetical protein